MYVYRTRSPVRLVAQIDGLYVDHWSGPTVEYQRYGCRRGVLAARLLGDPTLEPHRESVVASITGKTVTTKAFVPGRRTVSIRVPVHPSDGVCHVTFTVSPTVIPAQVPGSGNPDMRTLGVRFLSFAYRPG
jgi:hypothetical protein